MRDWNSVLQLLVTANVVPSTLNLFTLMMVAIRSSETLFLTRATRRHIPEDGIAHRLDKGWTTEGPQLQSFSIKNFLAT
jgi:hypothetical protein